MSTESLTEIEKPVENPNKKKTRDKCRLIKRYFMDYTVNSNLHGLKYIGERERTAVEKVYWVLVFTCCVILCAVLIRKVWNKWNESPVIVTFAENTTPVWQIPYPAVTICPETKVQQRVFNFTHYHYLYNNESEYERLTKEERNLFEDVTLVCHSYVYLRNARKFCNGSETIKNLKKVSPPPNVILAGCWWSDDFTICKRLFQPIITDEGICYTFNTLASDELFRIENLDADYSNFEFNKKSEGWTLEQGYPQNTPLETYPHRGTSYGVMGGLYFYLRALREDIDYRCEGPIQGFKMLLHNPAELPRMSRQYISIPFKQKIVIAAKPKMMTTSEGLKNYDPIVRRCYSTHERHLRYFKVYTQVNCEIECLTNFSYVRCGCVHFSMPRARHMKVCNTGSRRCLRDAQKELVTVEISSELRKESHDNDTLDKATKVAKKCKCLPACTSIEYEAETSQSELDWQSHLSKVKTPHIPDKPLMSQVNIFFKEAQFITSRRSELYGQTDFLANCGGLLGLFMGFSLLSVAEIIYFLTLRLYYVLRRQRKVEQATLEQVQNQQSMKTL